jgi:hypothetical protein
MVAKKNGILAFLVVVLSVMSSCGGQYVSGVVSYSVSSPDYFKVDNITYTDAAGNNQSTGEVTLPWSLSFRLDNHYTGDLQAITLHVNVSALNNKDGGSLTLDNNFSGNNLPVETVSTHSFPKDIDFEYKKMTFLSFTHY